MADKKPGDIMITPSGGMLRDIVMRLKLILRLMGDGRVNFFLKLLPVAALAYLISPIDLAPGIALPVIGALDDAAVVGLGAYLFIELCPPGVVQEHMKNLVSNLDPAKPTNDEIVDAEATDVPDDKQS
jgi:uncharacterized membrane protein YkvA (DUF1232 family)